MNRILILTLIATLLINTSQYKVIPKPKVPVQNADVLDELLSKYLGDSYSNNAFSDYILGTSHQTRRQGDTEVAGENLDINIIDQESVKKIVNFARNKYKEDVRKKRIQLAKSGRRRGVFGIWGHEKDFHAKNEYVIHKMFELMRHTIYHTKERIHLTRPYRKKYSQEHSYQIALLCGVATALLWKVENLVGQINYLHHTRSHFIWYLIVYEKVLATYTDISNTVERIYVIQNNYIDKEEKEKKNKKAMEAATNMTRKQNSTNKYNYVG